MRRLVMKHSFMYTPKLFKAWTWNESCLLGARRLPWVRMYVLCKPMSMFWKDAYDESILVHGYLISTSSEFVLILGRTEHHTGEAGSMHRSKWISTQRSLLRGKQQPLHRGPSHASLCLPSITEGGTPLTFSGLCHGSDTAAWDALFQLRNEQAGKHSLCNIAAIHSANSFRFVGPWLPSNEPWSNWWFQCF